jgi:hypothetical protein
MRDKHQENRADRMRRNYIQRQCLSKRVFASYREADIHRTRMLDADVLHAYQCNICRLWHVGHRRTVKQ